MTEQTSTEAAAEDDKAWTRLDGHITKLEGHIETLTADNAETLREHVRLGARKQALDTDLAMLRLDVDLLRNQVKHAQGAVDHEGLAERGRALEESLRTASQERHDVQQEMNRLLDDHGSVRRQVERLQSVLGLLRAQQYDLVAFGSPIDPDDLETPPGTLVDPLEQLWAERAAALAEAEGSSD